MTDGQEGGMTDDGETTSAAAVEGSPGVAWLVVYLKGVAMGTADAVPGVSGGTIALITGIYDRLVVAIASLDPRLLIEVVGAGDRWEALRDGLVEMDVPFLLVLGIGVMTGIATVSRVLELALDELRLVTFAFFFGLIAASAVALADEVSLETRGRAAAGAVGVVAAFVLVGEFRTGLGHSLPVVFLAGVVAISAMVLPGISGSFLLLVLGQLGYLAGTLNDFLDAVGSALAGGGTEGLFAPGIVVGTFGAGAAVGLLSVARVVEWALERDRAVTLTFLVGLMVGALRLPVREVRAEAGVEPLAWGAAVVAAAVGGVAILLLDRYTAGIGYE